MTYARVQLGRITSNPARIPRISGERAISAEESLLTDVEFEALLDAAKADDCRYAYTWVMSGLAFGPRAGELAKLRWRDVDAEEAVLRNTKNRIRSRSASRPRSSRSYATSERSSTSAAATGLHA